MPREENESTGVDVEGISGGDGCSGFLDPSPFPGPPATPKGARKAPIAGDDTVECVPISPTTLSGKGKTFKPPLGVLPSPNKSKVSSPINGFGDVEGGGRGIALTSCSSNAGEFGHNSPPRAAAWSTRICVR